MLIRNLSAVNTVETILDPSENTAVSRVRFSSGWRSSLAVTNLTYALPDTNAAPMKLSEAWGKSMNDNQRFSVLKIFRKGIVDVIASQSSFGQEVKHFVDIIVLLLKSGNMRMVPNVVRCEKGKGSTRISYSERESRNICFRYRHFLPESEH